jgi:RimJ/RimL family protein N-acetyltransferase
MQGDGGVASILGSELLRGDSIYLNGVTSEDIPQITQMMNDVGYARHLRRALYVPMTIEAMSEWFLGKHNHDEPTFAIRALDDNRLIGTCGFMDIRWPSRHSFFWIGIGDPANRGRGYGTDATRVMLKYAFLEMGLYCLALQVFSFNAPAIRTYEKVGFQHDGAMRGFQYRDGEHHDMLLMSMLNNEWEARYGADARQSISETAQES